MSKVQDIKKMQPDIRTGGGITAPRDVINKGLTEEVILNGAPDGV